MSYAVKELFLTLQGEGVNAGRLAVFVRFSGCNLWSGRQEDRDHGEADCARWCDTDFRGVDGPGGGRFATALDLAGKARALWPADPTHQAGRPFVVLTGGEPALQIDEALTTALHAEGFEIAIETNGTRPLPPGLDWICVSPKGGSQLVVRQGDELKLVYPQVDAPPERFVDLDFKHFLLQPMDGPERVRHTRAALDHCLAHGRWRLSLQTHKLLDIP